MQVERCSKAAASNTEAERCEERKRASERKRQRARRNAPKSSRLALPRDVYARADAAKPDSSDVVSSPRCCITADAAPCVSLANHGNIRKQLRPLAVGVCVQLLVEVLHEKLGEWCTEA